MAQGFYNHHREHVENATKKKMEMFKDAKSNKLKNDVFAKQFSEVREHEAPFVYEVLGQFHPEGIEEGIKYQKRRKGREAKIVYMTPDEYIEKSLKPEAYQGRTKEKLLLDIINEKNVDFIADKMLEGKKFGLPYLEYMGNALIGQEGRHRTLAAKKLGIAKIPVAIVTQ